VICIDGKELVPVEDVWLVLVSIFVTISVSILLCDVTVVDELVGLVVTVLDISVSLTSSVSIK
jgi:hypothetical protein